MRSLKAFHPATVVSNGVPDEYIFAGFLFNPAHWDDWRCSDSGQGQEGSRSSSPIWSSEIATGCVTD
jgi:hypothetical protein